MTPRPTVSELFCHIAWRMALISQSPSRHDLLLQRNRSISQLDKEGLSIIFGVKRYNQYVYGRHFTTISDHKPLQHLFSESSATPTLASARIQRWALILSAYDYHIEYKPGLQHGNADMLSRLPLPDKPASVTVPGETILLLDMLNSLPATALQIKQATDRASRKYAQRS